MSKKTLKDYRALALELYGPDSHALVSIEAQMNVKGGDFVPSMSEDKMRTLLKNWHGKTGMVFETPEPEPESNPAGDLLRSLGSKQ
jgi:hypothetical protein